MLEVVFLMLLLFLPSDDERERLLPFEPDRVLLLLLSLDEDEDDLELELELLLSPGDP